MAETRSCPHCDMVHSFKDPNDSLGYICSGCKIETKFTSWYLGLGFRHERCCPRCGTLHSFHLEQTRQIKCKCSKCKHEAAYPDWKTSDQQGQIQNLQRDQEFVEKALQAEKRKHDEERSQIYERENAKQERVKFAVLQMVGGTALTAFGALSPAAFPAGSAFMQALMFIGGLYLLVVGYLKYESAR